MRRVRDPGRHRPRRTATRRAGAGRTGGRRRSARSSPPRPGPDDPPAHRRDDRVVFASQATWLTIGFVSSGLASWSAASGFPPSELVLPEVELGALRLAGTSSPQPGRSKTMGEPTRSSSGLLGEGRRIGGADDVQGAVELDDLLPVAGGLGEGVRPCWSRPRTRSPVAAKSEPVLAL